MCVDIRTGTEEHSVQDLRHLTPGDNRNAALLHRWGVKWVCPVSTAIFFIYLTGALIPTGPGTRIPTYPIPISGIGNTTRRRPRTQTTTT